MFHVVAHRIAIHHSMQQEQRLDELPNSVFGRLAPGYTGMLGTGRVKSEVVSIERHRDTLLGRGKLQLIRIRQTTPSSFLRGQDVHALLS
jgi:hypothetical protein